MQRRAQPDRPGGERELSVQSCCLERQLPVRLGLGLNGCVDCKFWPAKDGCLQGLQPQDQGGTKRHHFLTEI